ncbi:hypothetical protein AAG570_000998 [Ranatra chinensis]|uniref:CAP-Gly domain-containing protein n=1 Tax=Ranatra chinensis TaxID=642074 RepID=A0ABD0YCG3_9HEMI
MIGTLVNVNSTINDKYVAIKIVNHEGQYNLSEEDLWMCPREALIHVDKTVWPLVSPIQSPVERVFLIRETGLCEELASIEVGTLVNVLHGETEEKSSPAVVKYKGPILKKGPGIYFGVELLDDSLEGDNDGSYGNQRLFSCPPGTGLFVTVNRLRLPKPSMLTTTNKLSVQQLKDKFEKMHKPYQPEVSNSTKLSTNKCECEASSLKVGDRVVWLSDDGPAAGVVRWLGCYENNQLRVSVQFVSILNSYFKRSFIDCSIHKRGIVTIIINWTSINQLLRPKYLGIFECKNGIIFHTVLCNSSKPD